MRGFAVAEDRDLKAHKIDAVLRNALNTDVIRNLSILDIGSGSGHIAAHFAKTNMVIASDIENQLCVDEPELRFVRLTDLGLPFEDSTFDVVILNQVLCCVPDQKHELEEVRRILKPTGVCYLANPNRAFPVEPITKIPFINYLPERVFDIVMRILTGTDERIRLISYWGIRNLIHAAEFECCDYTVEVLNRPAFYKSGVPVRFPAWRWISCLSPTNIFVLRPRNS